MALLKQIPRNTSLVNDILGDQQASTFQFLFGVLKTSQVALGHLEGRENDASQRMQRKLESIITSASTLAHITGCGDKSPTSPK